MWVNRHGKYPYINRNTWNTRAWLIIRKDPATATSTNRRAAALLFECSITDPRGKPTGTMELMGKWLLAYDLAHGTCQHDGSVPGRVKTSPSP